MISTVDADAVLSDTSLTRSNGASFVLNGIGQAVISGGASNNKLDATGFSGPPGCTAGPATTFCSPARATIISTVAREANPRRRGRRRHPGRHKRVRRHHHGRIGDTAILAGLCRIIHGGPGDDLIYGDVGND